jgi:hypothetical protein
MIKTLIANGAFVQVSCYSAPNVYNAGQGAGQLRYNTTTQQIEAYDGNNWISVDQSATVGLSYEAEEILRWAQTKRAEEADLKERLAKHPGLKDAWEKFQIFNILTREADAV